MLLARRPPTVRETYRLHRVQADFYRSPALYRAFVGGRGAGKSWVGAFDLAMRLRPDRTYLIGSPTSILMQDTTYPTFKALAEKMGIWEDVKLTPYPTATVRAKGGLASIRFRTAEDPEKMRGPNLSGVWLDEASLMDEDAHRINIAALREAGEQGFLTATFTPKGPVHWTYQVFVSGRPNTALFQARTGQNPFNPPDFETTLKQQYGETQFARQELGGEFVSIEGAEFPAEWFDWPGFWLDQFPADVRYKAVYLDPSKGVSDVGDYQALVRAALCVIDGRNTIVLDAELHREDVSAMTNRAIRCVKDWWPVQACGVEENGTMGFLVPEFQRAMTAAGVVQPWQPITNRVPKIQRIRRLGAYLSQRQVRIVNTPGGRLLRAQLGDFPLGEHDDGCDAAAGAVALLEALAAGG